MSALWPVLVVVGVVLLVLGGIPLLVGFVLDRLGEADHVEHPVRERPPETPWRP